VPPEFQLVCTGGERDITQSKGALMIDGSATQYVSDAVHLNCTAWGDTKQLGRVDKDVPISNAQTQTATATVTSTLTATSTSMPIATVTTTATQPPALSATPAPFTMNGTFSINFTFIGSYTTGFIKLTVNPVSGQVSGTMDGHGTWSGQDTCEDGTVMNWTSVRSFSGSLVGTVDTKTGALSDLKSTGMTGRLTTSASCSSPAQTVDIVPVLNLIGTIDLNAHTAKGQIECIGEYDTCEGDWHAGE